MPDSNEPKLHVQGADYEHVSADYFAHRRLRQGAAGWVLLAGLGVAYVISGDFAGWNFGLQEGGWGGLAIATLLMATMYTAMVFSIAELASAIPTAGGGYGFARRAFGPFGGYLTGSAILLEYAIAPAAIAAFIGGYTEGLFGVGGWPVYLTAYLVFVGLHLYGVGEALKVMFAVTTLAVVALVVFVVAMIPHFDAANLFDIPPNGAAGASKFLPMGYLGIWAAIPYAIWFFLAIEGVPLAAEETAEPEKNLPRGLIAGMVVLLVFAATILLVGPGGAGASTIESSGDPLQAALQSPTAYGGPSGISRFVAFVGLAGLIASFFSIIFAYSRQIFALSRAGYLPRILSLTGRRKTPVLALILPAIVGFVLSLFVAGENLILVAVFGATLSYILMMASHIWLRFKDKELHRPYRTPGGIATSTVALLLATLAFAAGLVDKPWIFLCAAVAYAMLIAWFIFFSRHHLVAQAPEEEFAAIEAAEAELAGLGET